MLRNITYTGFRVWGSVRKVERLVDPDTPALGHHYLRERLAEMPAVRSETPTHEPIVTLRDVRPGQYPAGGARDGRPTVAGQAQQRQAPKPSDRAEGTGALPVWPPDGGRPPTLGCPPSLPDT